MRVGTFAAVAGLVIDFGVPIHDHERAWIRGAQLVLVALFSAETILRLVWAERRFEHARRHWLEMLLLSLAGIEFVVAAAVDDRSPLSGPAFAGIQVYLVLRFLLGVARVQSWVAARSTRPALLLLVSYAAAAFAGAVLLFLPQAHAPDTRPWSFTEAFFTSTSAVSVTGLSVRDIGTELSLRGQVLLTALIQLGGLGLVGVVCVLAVVERGRLGVREVSMIGEAQGLDSPRRLRRFLVFAVAFTVGIEALGALALWAATEGLPLQGHDRAWWAVFHSISSFCNAGFALSAQGFTELGDRTVLLGLVSALVVLGGLGFTVHMDLLSLCPLAWLSSRRWRRRPVGRPGHELAPAERDPGAAPRLSLTSRLVLVTSSVLLGGGTLVFFLSERSGTLLGKPLVQAWMESLFQSVSARTAGFATVDFARVALPTLFVTIVLMAVGAAPLSTGGGVKTTTLAVSALAVRAMTRGRDDVDAFGRCIPRRVVHASIAIVALYGIGTLAVTISLLATQAGIRFEEALFESVSALSTVGLSTGVTARLDATGMWILSGAMIVGRIGPLALLWSFVARPGALRYRYPEEQVLVS